MSSQLLGMQNVPRKRPKRRGKTVNDGEFKMTAIIPHLTVDYTAMFGLSAIWMVN
jgi:hypothetical protein